MTKRAAAQFSTSVYLLYDDRNLYVGFRAQQPGVPISSSQTTNNVGFGLDDFVGAAVDTSGAGKQVYFFETTPRGIRYQQSSENTRYNPRWQSAARADKNGWSAVLIIPLNAVRLSQKANKIWRVNFIRGVAALGEHYTWAYSPIMVDGAVGPTWPTFSDSQYWPELAIDGLSARVTRPKPRAELYGLESFGADRNQFQQGNGTFGAQSVRSWGVDFTIPLTNTINAVGTLNPDFSNIEIDQQTIVPQEFPRQLQEYRPFFAQGANFLNVDRVGFSSTTSPNNEIFYSPRIGPFDRGAKIEGSFGLQSFGLLTFRGFDETSGNTLDDMAYGYQHALADSTFAYWADGVIAHHSLAGNDTTSDAGITGKNLKSGFQWGADQMIESGSWVPAKATAHQTLGYVGMVKPNWESFAGYNSLSPNFNPIDGLTFNSDIHGFQTFDEILGSAKWAKNYTLFFNGDRWFDGSGAVHESDAMLNLAVVFRNGLSIDSLGPSFGTLRSYDVLADNNNCAGAVVGTSSFTGFPCYRNGHDERFNLFQAAVGYKNGTPQPVDFSLSFGPFGGNYTQLYSAKTSRPLGHFTLGLEYDGTVERSLATGMPNSQWLRRVSLGDSLGPESNLSLSIQSVNGLGGFATQTGTNVAFGYHRRFASGDELYVNYGTPAAFKTLNRFIIKYVFNVGGDAGT